VWQRIYDFALGLRVPGRSVAELTMRDLAMALLDVAGGRPDAVEEEE